jgi:tRNA nucleotidyltransferase (CCA-adding enzyme)
LLSFGGSKLLTLVMMKSPGEDWVLSRQGEKLFVSLPLINQVAVIDTRSIHTIDGYNVRAQVIALVREHLKPGEFYKKRDEVGEGAFRRLARRCELDLLYRVAKADSLGRNADWVPREQWYGSEAQEWFRERARELQVEKRAPEPILLGRHLLELGVEPGPAMGEITRAVYEMQLDGRVRTLEDAIAEARKLIGRG